ncbi:hypothetical protein [Moraxella oblonga]|uniref:hypothetical protein n=1 Tax=Moraxella oblonga TaxID=200413 RepID=UPI000832E442|nr:hypothetical protein [Moraxella oblonga]
MSLLIEKMQTFIDKISATQFLMTYVIVWVLAIAIGYFLVGGFYVFMMCIFMVVGALTIYKYRTPPIRPNNSTFLMPVFGLIYAGFLHSGLLFAPELIHDKSQATTITGIVPETRGHHRTSGKRARDFYYLVIDGSRFHCDDDDGYDACDKVYAYHGQMAKIWSHDGLAYEIEINGQKIYEFNAQLDKFKASQYKRKWQLIWSVILFGLPSVVFYFINKRFIRGIEVIDESALQAQIQKQQDFEKFKKQQFKCRVGASGQTWRILFGGLATLLLFISIMVFFAGMKMGAGVLFIVIVVFYYVAGIPYRHAKQEVDEFYQMADDNDMGDLLDYELSGFYHHMGVISWVGLIVALLVICLNLFIIIMSFYKNHMSLLMMGVILLIVLLALVGFIIKRAMNDRDWALEE